MVSWCQHLILMMNNAGEGKTNDNDNELQVFLHRMQNDGESFHEFLAIA